ncbi:MAG: hypothetical protein RR420_01210 [Anaerovoracaceae bacterium]
MKPVLVNFTDEQMEAIDNIKDILGIDRNKLLRRLVDMIKGVDELNIIVFDGKIANFEFNHNSKHYSSDNLELSSLDIKRDDNDNLKYEVAVSHTMISNK